MATAIHLEEKITFIIQLLETNKHWDTHRQRKCTYLQIKDMHVDTLTQLLNWGSVSWMFCPLDVISVSIFTMDVLSLGGFVHIPSNSPLSPRPPLSLYQCQSV